MARGGKQPGAGRPPGSLNKATADVKQAARKHGPAAVKKLVSLMNGGKTEQVQFSAAKEILDRAYGKATQPVEGPGEDGAFELVHTIRLVAATANDKSTG